MKIKKFENGDIYVWLSAKDTYKWANRPNYRWPCSFLANKRVFVQLNTVDDSVNLIDLRINGNRGNQDCPSDELNAILSDHVTGVHVEED